MDNVLEKIKNYRNSGKSFAAIAKSLNDAGIKTASGKAWSVGNLSNYFYTNKRSTRRPTAVKWTGTKNTTIDTDALATAFFKTLPTNKKIQAVMAVV